MAPRTRTLFFPLVQLVKGDISFGGIVNLSDNGDLTINRAADVNFAGPP